ncbi:MAG: hypothetical protein HW388_1629 [Dehalococcoidia bacterium]|nr:hypothetical protein [Dehalococcoidia bacterium]
MVEDGSSTPYHEEGAYGGMIHIGMDPNIIEKWGLVLSWHGLFSFIAVVVAVVLVARWARREGMVADVVYSTATWAIIGGIVGARAFHVIDRWDYYVDNPGDILAIWNGGIALFGAILGGFAGGVAYAKLSKYPVGKLADLAAPAVLVGQFIGRIGDIINGEHIAKPTSFSWGFVYTHPDSLSNQVWGLAASHPVAAYEMIWDVLVLGALWWLRSRIKPDGMLFVLYLAFYSFGRFFISFLRMDKVWFAGLQEAHVIAILVLAVTVPLLVYRGRWMLWGEESRPPGRARPKQRR